MLFCFLFLFRKEERKGKEHCLERSHVCVCDVWKAKGRIRRPELASHSGTSNGPEKGHFIRQFQHFCVGLLNRGDRGGLLHIIVWERYEDITLLSQAAVAGLLSGIPNVAILCLGKRCVLYATVYGSFCLFLLHFY